MGLNPLRPHLRLLNGSNDVAKVELRVQAGDEIVVPEGSVIELERSALSVLADGIAPAAEDAPGTELAPEDPAASPEPEATPAAKPVAKKAPAKRAAKKATAG